MLERFVGYLRRTFWNRHDQCYEFMESTGYATTSCCGGLYSPDKSQDNLQSDCMDCPYLTLTDDPEMPKDRKE